MQKFQFSLESALQYRQTQFELEQSRLEALFAELHTLTQQQDELIAEGAAADRLVKGESSTMSLSLIALDTFNRHVSVCRTALEERKVDCLKRIGAQQVSVLEARRDHELLARVKQRREQQWHKDWQKEQEDLASELFLANWGRRQPA